MAICFGGQDLKKAMSHHPSRAYLLFMLFVLSMCLPCSGQAASKGKAKSLQQVQKERVVLMPLQLDESDQELRVSMESALVEGLQQRFEVKWGEEVEKKAKDIFRKENQKHECNEERCMQGIAEAFQAELLAVANIKKQSDGYFLSLTVQNLYDHVVVITKSLPCKGCDAYAVVDKLKELVGLPAPVTSTSLEGTPQAKVNLSDPETALWEEVKKGNAAEDYRAYLNQYPKGKFIALAKTKLARMKDEAKAETEKQEQQSWEDAQQSASQESYDAYLSVYPKGRFAALAQARIVKLKKEAAQNEAQQAARTRTEFSQSRTEPVVESINVTSGTRLLTNKNFKPGEPERFALVIGNSNYQSPDVPKLGTPANDANAMADTLYKLGFSVIVAINADQKSMNRAIMSFGEQLGPSSISLFYYAGHALQVKGKNYLVPVDADISRESMVSAETVDMDSVLENTSSSKVGITILDACRKNPFKTSRLVVGGDGGLAQITNQPMGSFIAYATSPGRTSIDDVGSRHSIYTSELIRNIVKPGLSIDEVFKNVRIAVMKASSDEQFPWESSSMTGAFYFNGASVSQ